MWYTGNVCGASLMKPITSKIYDGIAIRLPVKVPFVAKHFFIYFFRPRRATALIPSDASSAQRCLQILFCHGASDMNRHTLTHSLTAARNQLWVVAPSTLTGRRQEPMRQQQ